MNSLVGQILDGKYQIRNVLGSGGMGTVFLAVHIGTRRPVAVKVINPQLMEQPEFVERFRREAEASGRLRHPNVVDVTDFGFADVPNGRAAYLVMEYLDGCTLGEVLSDEKTLSLAWTVDILDQVCSAVQEAHSNGIIHRDLKPDNIWIEPDRRGSYTIKVLDFGLAKLEGYEGLDSAIAADDEPPPSSVLSLHELDTLIDEGDAENAGGIPRPQRTSSRLMDRPVPRITGDAGLKRTDGTRRTDGERAGPQEITRVGAILGTPTYMSPEQCGGEWLSSSSDIYSLGVIAYQMLSGKPPFEGESLSIMLGHLHTPPPALPSRGIPRKVRRVIAQALSKNPVERPENPELFGRQMRSYSESVLKIFQRSLVLFSENVSSLLLIGSLLFMPVAVPYVVSAIVIIAGLGGMMDLANASVVVDWMMPINRIFSTICETLMTAAVIWAVFNYFDAPLKKVRARQAIASLGRHWRQLAWIVLLLVLVELFINSTTFAFSLLSTTLFSFISSLLFWPLLYVVIVEDMGGFAAIKRGLRLTAKAPGTIAASLLIIQMTTMFVVIAVTIMVSTVAVAIGSALYPPFVEEVGSQGIMKLLPLFMAIVTPLLTVLYVLFVIVRSFLYLKVRNAGGESMIGLLDKFKESGPARSRWQQLIHDRIAFSEKIKGTMG